MDVKRYAEAVKDSGLKKCYIALKLGMSYQSYLNRENGKSEFTASEMAQLKVLLNLSNKQVAEIFLS